jgi:hypothetical protein
MPLRERVRVVLEKGKRSTPVLIVFLHRLWHTHNASQWECCRTPPGTYCLRAPSPAAHPSPMPTSEISSFIFRSPLACLTA